MEMLEEEAKGGHLRRAIRNRCNHHPPLYTVVSTTMRPKLVFLLIIYCLSSCTVFPSDWTPT
jgi:hypothetical protein